MNSDDFMKQVNPTARACYERQGYGHGTGNSAVQYFEQLSGEHLGVTAIVLDVGFGNCDLLTYALKERNVAGVYGVDICNACREVAKPLQKDFPLRAFFHYQDVSHEALPLAADVITHAFCTETIEHMSNPFYAVAQIKRVLQHGGYFTLSFPQPENNLGYGGGEHGHIYPFFLKRESFEIFMRQLYFKPIARTENGASAWYVYRNYKDRPGIVDVFEIISGNYTEERLFGAMDAYNFEDI